MEEETPQVTFWSLLAALGISAVVAVGFLRWLYPLAALGILGALLLGLVYPRALLIAAIAWVPFTGSLSGGDQRLGFLVAFGVSDVLFCAALPGTILRVIRTPERRPALGPLGWPTMLYLAAGIVSFALNLPAMRGETVAYLTGFARTAQVVFLLPLAYAALPWPPVALRWLGAGYLAGISVMIAACLTGFGVAGDFRILVLDTHKNSAGLAIAAGALIALAYLTELSLRLTRAVRGGLWSITLLAPVAIGSLVARSSLVCLIAGIVLLTVLRRRWQVVVVAVFSVIAFYGAVQVVSARFPSVPPEMSGSLISRRGRQQQTERALKVIRTHWLMGDGFRTRRDYHPHNLELTVLAENGVIGFGLFVWLLAAQTGLLLRARRVVADDPERAAFCLSVLACSVAVLLHAQFDPFWRRGPLWLPWAGTGIVLALLSQPKTLSAEAGEKGLEGQSETDSNSMSFIATREKF